VSTKLRPEPSLLTKGSFVQGAVRSGPFTLNSLASECDAIGWSGRHGGQVQNSGYEGAPGAGHHV